MAPPYVELHCHSNFSFLDGGSHPYELVARAAELEMPALAITDTGGVYGAVRFLQACRKLGVKPMIGTALEVDGEELVLIARNLRGYSNLCRLRADDSWILEGRAGMARRCGAPIVATNAVHYHVHERQRLHDVLVAIRHRATLDDAREHLFSNSEHCLKGGDEIRPLFRGHEEA